MNTVFLMIALLTIYATTASARIDPTSRIQEIGFIPAYTQHTLEWIEDWDIVRPGLKPVVFELFESWLHGNEDIMTITCSVVIVYQQLERGEAFFETGGRYTKVEFDGEFLTPKQLLSGINKELGCAYINETIGGEDTGDPL